MIQLATTFDNGTVNDAVNETEELADFCQQRLHEIWRDVDLPGFGPGLQQVIRNGQSGRVLAPRLVSTWQAMSNPADHVSYLSGIENPRWDGLRQSTEPGEFRTSDGKPLCLPDGINVDNPATLTGLALACDIRDAAGFEGQEAVTVQTEAEDAVDGTLRLPRLPKITPGRAARVPDYSGYAITTEGDVLSCQIGGVWKALKQRTTANGYRMARMRKDGKRVEMSLARLVLETFRRPAREGEQVWHANLDRADCRLSNLAWRVGRAAGMPDIFPAANREPAYQSLKSLRRDPKEAPCLHPHPRIGLEPPLGLPLQAPG